MKKETKNKIKELKPQALKEKLNLEKQELLSLRFKHKTGKNKDLHAYAKKRKEIALIRTLIRQKQLEGAV